MLRNILNSWDNIVVLPETHFIVPLYDKYELRGISVEDFLSVVNSVYGSSGQPWVEVIVRSANKEVLNYREQFVEYVGLNNIKGNIKNYIEAFYEFLYGKGFIFGDKTPHYGTTLNIINAIWPNAKIIHLVRDGVYSSYSMLKHNGFRKNINGMVSPCDLERVIYAGGQSTFSSKEPSMENALMFCKDVIETMQCELENIKPEYKLKLKYEDIIFNSVEEITRVSQFLGVDSERGALKKAVTIPRPFPQRHQVKKVSEKEYSDYYHIIEPTMKKFGYP
jgi:hypothetical protein